MDIERREIRMVVDESEFPPQMKNMKTKPLVSKSLGLLSMCYHAENEGKKILIYDENDDTFVKIDLDN